MNLRLLSNGEVHGPITPITGGQATAAQLNPGVNILIDSGTDWDSLQLPYAIEGAVVIGFFQGIQTHYVGIFAKNGTSDTIFGQSNNSQFDFPTSDTVGTGQILIAVCFADGTWVINAAED